MATVIALILIGAALMLLETILPGMIAGIIGLGCLISGVVMAYLHFDLRTANLITLGVVAGLILGTLGWMKFFPDSPIARVFISQGRVGNVGAEKPELLHQTGTAATVLRPSGTAIINGRRVDVVTEGDLVERGAPIRVVAVEGMRVVVRAVT
jgi:membrane-bound ClpP family serine protease